MGYYKRQHLRILEAPPMCFDGCNCRDCRYDRAANQALAQLKAPPSLSGRKRKSSHTVAFCPKCDTPLNGHTEQWCRIYQKTVKTLV